MNITRKEFELLINLILCSIAVMNVKVRVFFRQVGGTGDVTDPTMLGGYIKQ